MLLIEEKSWIIHAMKITFCVGLSIQLNIFTEETASHE